MTSVIDPDLGHAFTTETFGNALTYIYTEIDSGFTSLGYDDNWTNNGRIIRFDQSEFDEYTGEGSSGLRGSGWMYYPTACIGATCKIVFYLHGGGGYGITDIEYGIG